jgi:hypothetical protein
MRGYRRRAIARVEVLNALVGMVQAAATTGKPYARVAVVLPEAEIAAPAAALFASLGFTPELPLPGDPSDLWRAPEGAPAPRFALFTLPFDRVVPLLHAAAEAGISIRPTGPRAAPAS